jgi:hypothetical protein
MPGAAKDFETAPARYLARAKRFKELPLEYLLLTMGCGLQVWAAAVALKNFDKVVQVHRQSRLHIAPENLPVKPRLSWTTAKWAFLGAWLPLISCHGHCGGARRNGRHQSESGFGDAPRHFLAGCALDQWRQWTQSRFRMC